MPVEYRTEGRDRRPGAGPAGARPDYEPPDTAPFSPRWPARPVAPAGPTCHLAGQARKRDRREQQRQPHRQPHRPPARPRRSYARSGAPIHPAAHLLSPAAENPRANHRPSLSLRPIVSSALRSRNSRAEFCRPGSGNYGEPSEANARALGHHLDRLTGAGVVRCSRARRVPPQPGARRMS